MAPSTAIRLIYISQATTPFDDTALIDLAAKAAENNKTVEVTGLLMRVGNYFLQVLEGPTVNVRKLFAKIAEDPRHTSVRTVYQEDAPERAFGQWSMSYLRVDDYYNVGTGEFLEIKNAVADTMGSGQSLKQSVAKAITTLPALLKRYKINVS